MKLMHNPSKASKATSHMELAPMLRCLALVLVCALSTSGQSISGELRLKVTDPSGRGLESRVELTSEANDYRKTFATDERFHRRHSCGVRKKNRRHCRTQRCARYARTGLHGQVDLSGGSFDTGGTSAQAQYGWGRNSVAVSADGNHTDRYLNPPVVQNFTNSGTTGDFAASYERDLTERDRVSVSVRHELPRFLVPNEQLQQAAGQRQDRDNFETMGMGSYQHVFSPNAVGDFSGMVRDNANDLSSNPNSTPVIAF